LQGELGRVGAGERGDIDIDAIGKQRIVLDHRPQPGKIDRLRIGHEEHHMRIAHIDGDRIGQIVPRDRHRQGIHRIGQRNVVPAKPRSAHRDADAVCSGAGRNRSAQSLDAGFAVALVGEQQTHRAAGIAAGFDFAAVGIENAHAHIGMIAGSEHDQLIAADPGHAVGQRGRAARGHHDRVRARVDHDEIVAQAMHLAKRNAHGGGY